MPQDAIVLAARVLRTDAAALQAAARQAGMPFARWVRVTLFRAAGLPDPPPERPGWPKGRRRKAATIAQEGRSLQDGPSAA